MRRWLALLLLLALDTAALPFVFAQDQQRPRTVLPADPAASPRPVESPDPPLRIFPARSKSSAPATLAELKSRIEEIAHQPALEPGLFALKIFSLDAGKTIYEHYRNKFVRPPPNTKLST